MAEILDIKEALEKGSLMGPSKMRLSQSMWEASRSEIFKLPFGLTECLRKLYVKVGEVNGTIDYDVNHSGYGAGHFDQTMGVKAAILDTLVSVAIKELRAHLKIEPPPASAPKWS